MLFVLSKIVGYGLRLETLLALLLLLTLLGARRYPRAARRMLATALTLMVMFGLFPVGDLLLLPLERRFEQPELPAQVDGIIILGGAEDLFRSEAWDIPTTHQGADRLIAGAALAHRFPRARIIVTGGAPMTVGHAASGGDWMARILTGLGVEGARVVVEGDSRNTVENVRLSADLVDTRGTWVLVTSAFHIPRSVGIFRQSGWDVIAWPVDHRSGNGRLKPDWDLAEHMRDWNTGLKEWVGLVSYRLLGWTDALFPGP